MAFFKENFSMRACAKGKKEGRIRKGKREEEKEGGEKERESKR